MGKAKSWFKRLVAKIRSDANPKDKRNLGKSYTNEADSRRLAAEANSSSSSAPEVTGYGTDDAGKHAIAVAAASAVAAEAALAAAKAAAAVVRLTSSGRCYTAPSLHITIDAAAARETSAVLVIQSHFRGYLARRALRALKGLVKLQALVRGHITRRKTAETIRRIEAMLRAQARAISLRSYGSPISSEKSSQSYLPGPQTPEKLEMTSYSRISSNTQSPILSKGSGSVSRSINRVIIHPDNSYLNSPGWSESQVNRHYRTAASCSTEEDKILEIDTGKQQHQYGFFDDPRKNLSRSIQDEEDENVFCTAQSSPQLCSRRLSPMTPTKSDTSAASCRSGYSDCPSYMAYTESSRARMRASSAPRQRPEQCSERAGSRKTASSAATQACFASKAYTGSGRLDRLGVPIGNNENVYYSGCLN